MRHHGSAFYCGLIHRDSSGSLGLTNAGYITGTAGQRRLAADRRCRHYHRVSLPLSRLGFGDYGSLSLDSTTTWLDGLRTESIPGSGEKFNCAGYYGESCGTPNPHWRSKTRLTWNTPWYGVQLSGQWRYFGDVHVDLLNGSPQLNGDLAANGAIPDAKLPAQNYFDLTASIKIKDNYTFRVGVENIFDKQPPWLALTSARPAPVTVTSTRKCTTHSAVISS